MAKEYNWRRVLAIVCSVVFGITLSISLVAYNVEQRIFEPETYKQVLLDQRVCEQFPMIVSKQILSSAQSAGPSNLMGRLIGSIRPENMENFIHVILPCDLVQSVIFNGIDQVFFYINSATDQSSLPLGALKESLRVNSGTAVDEYLNTLPDCSPATLLQMGANALFGQGDSNSINPCNPPDALKDIFRIPLLMVVESAFQIVPNQIALNEGLTELLNLLRTLRLIMNMSIFIPLIFLALTTILVVRSWRNLLLWWGYPLLAGGLVTLLISLAVAPMVYYSLSTLLLPRLPVTLVPEAIQLISNLLSGVTDGLAAPIQLQAAVLSVIGLGMVLGEKLTRKK